MCKRFHGCNAVAPLKLPALIFFGFDFLRFHGCNAVAPLKLCRQGPEVTPSAAIPRLQCRGPIEMSYNRIWCLGRLKNSGVSG